VSIAGSLSFFPEPGKPPGNFGPRPGNRLAAPENSAAGLWEDSACPAYLAAGPVRRAFPAASRRAFSRPVLPSPSAFGMPPPTRACWAQPCHRSALGPAHGFHHVGHRAVHFEELVDVLGAWCLSRRRCGACGFALSTSGFLRFLRRHRIDDRHLPLEDRLVEVALGQLVFFIFAMPAASPSIRSCRPWVWHLRELLAQIGQDRTRLCAFLRDAGCLLGIDGRGGFFPPAK